MTARSHLNCQGSGAAKKCYNSVPHALIENFLLQPWSPPPFFVLKH